MAKNDFRVTFIFKIIIRICKTNVEFCGKTPFYPKDVCSFSVFFIYVFFISVFFILQVCQIKYVENEISNSTSHKKKKEGKE